MSINFGFDDSVFFLLVGKYLEDFVNIIIDMINFFLDRFYLFSNQVFDSFFILMGKHGLIVAKRKEGVNQYPIILTITE